MSSGCYTILVTKSGRVLCCDQADARHAFVGVPPCLMTEAIATPTAVEAADKAILNFLESNGSDFGSETKLNDAANGGSGRTRS